MFVINIDTKDFARLEKLPEALQVAANKAAQEYATMVYGKGVEIAHKELHTRLQSFMEHYHKPEPMSGEQGTWIINLDEKWKFLDDGMDARDMLEDLLKSPKADAHGNVIVPFKHGPGKGPAQVSPAQLDLIQTIKSEMRKRNIPFNKIELDDNGKAKLGKLYSFDITRNPPKTQNGPYQGSGPIGAVRQGITGIPLLQGVSVYQRQDPKSKFGAKKEIFTFRTASPKQRGKGMWMHPGIKPANIFSGMEKWGQEHIEEFVVPRIMQEIDKL